MGLWERFCMRLKSNHLVLKILQLKLFVTLGELAVVWLVVVKGVEWIGGFSRKANNRSKTIQAL